MYRNSYIEDLPYEGYIGHSLRIGDTLFYVPPTSIKVQHQMKNERVPLMRSRHSIVKNSGYFNKLITFTLYFPNKNSINNELRPLLSQMQKCPFLPVENEFLNDQHSVEAITIVSVSTQTLPGFPHCLVATIQCNAFDPGVYIYDGSGRRYEEMFNWPLFRWYYKRSLINKGNVTYYEPVYSELDNQFSFRIANEDQLAALKEIRSERSEKIQQYVRERKEKFWGQNELEEEFYKDMESYKNKVNEVGDIDYDTIDTTGLILTNFSAMVENRLTDFQLQMEESPGQQYLGSQETMFIAEFETKDPDCVSILSNLVHQSARLAREYNREVKGSILEFDHQLTRLFGCTFMTIEDISFVASADHRGIYKVSLTMLGANRINQKAGEVEWLSKGAEWDISAHDGTTALGSLTPELIPPTEFDKMTPAQIEDYYNIFKAIPFANSPMAKETIQTIKNIGKDLKLDSTASKRVEYESHIIEAMKSMELYPDLELPTYAEVKKAGFNIKNPTNGVFVDPDFFIVYSNKATSTEQGLDFLNQQETNASLRDATGGEADARPGKLPHKVNNVTKSQTEETKKIVEGESSSKKDWDNYHDKDNISKSKITALIRQKADEKGMDQDLPVAFAEAFDRELRQFYSVGLNKELNYRTELKSGVPVEMNNKLVYTKVKGKKNETRYYGVMKVPSKTSDSELVAYNIKNNIDAGVSQLDEMLKKASRMERNADKNGYDLNNVKNTFNITNLKGDWDEQQALYIGAFMMYFGFDKEYADLLKSGKTPDKQTISLVNNFLKFLNERHAEKNWSTTKIDKELKGVKIKDVKAKQEPEDEETPYKGSYTDTNKDDLKQDIDKGMFYDSTYYDRRGRLVRAFPTFLMLFIDEGKFVGSVKLSDQFFHYQPVQDIMYVNSRKNASSTLYLELNNVYGSLTNSEAAMDVSTTTYREVFQMLTMPGLVAQNAERTRQRWQEYHKSIFLTSGTRIHFRMGYSSNALALPTIMNGTITSVQNGEESLSVVAQDDGYELANKLRVQADETTGGFIFSKKEPTEIVAELLTDSQGFFKNAKALFSNKEYQFHSLGIMHFGSPGMPDGLNDLKSFVGGAIGGATAGAGAGAVAGAFAGGVGAVPGAIAGAIGGAVLGGIAYAKETDNHSEIMQNIYSTNGLSNDENDKWYNHLQDALGIGDVDEDNISINLYDKSVWDVLNICAYLGPDHIVAVHPFGFRNTIFSGRPYFPLKYDYVVENGKPKGIAMKPFKQLHVFDSYTSIIGNSIKATEDNIRTVAIGAYMDNGEIATTEPVYADINLWPEKQRVVNIDTTMNAKGINVLNHVPLIGKLINKPFKWYFDKGVAIQITAAQLREYLRDMYDGYLTVVGYPSIKPYDMFYLYDDYNEMSGALDVKEVIQIMNFDVGYITMIRPDLVVCNRDARLLTMGTYAAQFASKVIATWATNKMLRKIGFGGDSPIVTALWGLGKHSLDKTKKSYARKKAKTKGYIDKLTGQKISSAQIEAANDRRNGTSGIKDTLKRASKSGKLTSLLKKMKVSAKSEDVMRAIMGSKKIAKNSKLAKKVAPFLNSSKKMTKNIKKSSAVAGSIAMLSNPVGIVAKLIEMVVVNTTLGSIGELVNRYAISSQAVLMAPIQRGGIEFSAGINGHQGSVVGDSPTFWKNFLSHDVILSSLFRYDNSLFASASDVMSTGSNTLSQPSFAKSAKSKKKKDLSHNVNNFVEKHRKVVTKGKTTASYNKMIEADRKALKGMTNLSSERAATKADYTPEKEKITWKQIKEKFKNWLTSVFDYVKDFVKDLVKKMIDELLPGGSESSKRDCAVKNIDFGGKAVNLSKGMKHIGPIIEKWCKKGNIEKYTEVMKAMCMVESSGDYIRTPDCMQSSESAGHGRNYFTNPEDSIHQAVIAIKDAIRMGQHKCDLKTIVQAYNYGSQFAKYALTHNSGKWSYKTAHDFACKMRPGSCHYGNDEYIFRLSKYYKMPGGNGDCSSSEDDKKSDSSKSKSSSKKKSGSSSSSKNLAIKSNMKDISQRKESDYNYSYNIYAQTETNETIDMDGIDMELTPSIYKTSKDDELHQINASELRIIKGDHLFFNPMGKFKNSVARFRKGTVDGLKTASDRHNLKTGNDLTIVGGFIKNAEGWLGTGWGVELQMPDGLKVIGGKSRYPKGEAKEEAEAIIDSLLVAGFDDLACGDYDLVQQYNNRYGIGTLKYIARRKTLRCNYIK